MIELTISTTDLTELRRALLSDGIEECAVLFASPVVRQDGSIRLLVRDYQLAEPTDYVSHDALHAILRPEILARVTKRARLDKMSLVFVHSHVGNFSPTFSMVDDDGEETLAKFLAHRVPDTTHAALVISKGGMRGRKLGDSEEIRVVSLGDRRAVEFEPGSETTTIDGKFDRQVRAFGKEGQEAIQQLCVGIVGLGGTGSLVAQQLVHLGVRRFVLVDPDVIEETNLNRVVNALPVDVGTAKVDVAAKYIKAHSPDAEVHSIVGDIIRVKIAKQLLEADVIFGCTDSHGSRSILQQIAYQYLIPCIDTGTTITSVNGAITGIFGRAQLLSPSTACFSCSGLLNSEEVRRDMMTAFERKLDPYIQGEREPAPAVISLNGAIVSIAVTMFMAFVTSIPSASRYVIYNAKTCTLRAVSATANSECFICSRSGTLGRGNSLQLFGRMD